MSDDGYNGWKNYETWSVALIVDNDEPLYRLRRSLVKEWAEEAREDVPEWSTEADHVRFAVADKLKDWITSEQPYVGDGFEAWSPWSYLWSQLIGAALSEVDWTEIAENWLEELADA